MTLAVVDDSVVYEGAKGELEDGSRVDGGGGRRGRDVNIVCKFGDGANRQEELSRRSEAK